MSPPPAGPRPSRSASLSVFSGRIPFPVPALGVCLLFAAAGVAVLDDYGVGPDELAMRRNAVANVDYITGRTDSLTGPDRFYGVVFQLPLLLAERVPGLRDYRDILLTRHLLVHLFFVAGGFFCGLLAWRMFNDRRLALLAQLFFLLHPRLYANSFFNGKDIPFLVMFMVALYLTHRAFRRDTAGAFALLGAAVGLAVNLRPAALLLVPPVLVLRGLDLRQAVGGGRRRILLTSNVFAACFLAAVYVSQPWYWDNPLRFVLSVLFMARHPIRYDNLFQGQLIPSDAVPPEYVPVWFGITAPPAPLLLGCAGIAAVCWRGWRSPGRVLRDRDCGFLFLLLGCFVLPVAAVIVSGGHLHDGWRHMFFLWAPFCLLATAGMDALCAAPGFFPARIGGGIRRGWRAAMYGAVVAGLGGVVHEMASLHPHQQVYFNPLANRMAPGELGQRYDMDVGRSATRAGLEYLLERSPDAAVHVSRLPYVVRNRTILPADERNRVVLADPWDLGFRITTPARHRDAWERARAAESGITVHERRAYGSAYLRVTAPRLVWGSGARPGRGVYREAYRALAAAGRPAAQSVFDVHLGEDALYYVGHDCTRADTEGKFFIHVFPRDPDDLPDGRRAHGFDAGDFDFAARGGFFDGKCITKEPLPEYGIARIRTGQHVDGELTWQADFPAGGRARR